MTMDSKTILTRTRGSRWARRWLSGITLLVALGVGYVARPILHRHPPASPPEPDEHTAVTVSTGPWGELSYVPITIAAPDELLPVHKFEATPAHWVFIGSTRAEVAALFEQLQLPASQREQLLSAPALQSEANGRVDILPPCEIVMALAPEARREIYRRIVVDDELGIQLLFVPVEDVDENFHRYGVSNESIALFKQLSCRHGNYLVIGGVACLLQALPSYEEKAHVMKALTQQKTLLMKLYVTPRSDIHALATYWGKGCWTTDVRALLESLSMVPGGAHLDVIELLPPFPTMQLYTFPVPQNPREGPPVKQDCNWTAFNFFRDKPDSRFADANYIEQVARDDYYPVVGDPRYGDLVLLKLPNGMVVHVAVFIADDIFYTKNGPALMFPWLFAKLSDLLDIYSFRLNPGEKLTVEYLRNKYY